MKIKLSALLLVLLLNLPSLVNAATINVAVASNFKHTLEELKVEFEKNNQGHINIITASTGQLVQQIKQGAPFDILLAANTAHPQALWQHIHKQRHLKNDALFTYAIGRLVFYSNTPLKTGDTLERLLSTSQMKRISVANARLAPYGLASEQTLKCMNQFTHWKNKLVVGQNIAQAFQFIDSGNVDGGFVAMSQVLDKPLQNIRLVDETCYTPIKQSGLLLNNKESSRAFMNFLTLPSTKNIIELHGYLLPNP